MNGMDTDDRQSEDVNEKALRVFREIDQELWIKKLRFSSNMALFYLILIFSTATILLAWRLGVF